MCEEESMKKLFAGLLICALLALPGMQRAVWAGPLHANPIIHIVQWGENLTSIASRYGTTIQAIMNANGLANPNWIYAGQRLDIPGYAPPPVPSGNYYVVRYGDTLSGIAYQYGITISALMRANNIVNPNMIYPGQRLVIPGTPQPAPAPIPGGVYYTVQAGDTLAKIAVRYGTSVWTLVKANNIANPNVIYTGQRLFIPKSTTPPPPPVKPGCEHLQWPTAGARLCGVVQAKGTADLANFWYYKLEFRQDGLDEWHYITGAQTPVTNGNLGAWDTRSVPDGTYMFRIVVVDKTGNYPPACEIAVQVRNDP
jgi:LysM repeat protein